MNNWLIAGLTIAGLIIFWFVTGWWRGTAPNEKARKAIGAASEKYSRADISLLSCLVILSILGPTWIFGNIIYGNHVAIDAIVIWIDSINGPKEFAIHWLAQAVISILPSVGQWWRIHFKINFEDSDGKWCLRLQAVDWLLNTVGFYSYAMPLGYPPNIIGAVVVFTLSGILAGVVGVWGENIIHRNLTDLQWLILTPADKRGDRVATIYEAPSSSKKTQAKIVGVRGRGRAQTKVAS